MGLCKQIVQSYFFLLYYKIILTVLAFFCPTYVLSELKIFHFTFLRTDFTIAEDRAIYGISTRLLVVMLRGGTDAGDMMI